MIKYLDMAIEKASVNPLLPTFAAGLAGLGWYISFLEHRGIIKDYIDDDIDEALLEALKYYIGRNEYDYLHGATGVALYFYQRYLNTADGRSMEAINLFIEYIDSTKQADCNGIKWVSHNSQTKNEEYNISLSHGISSILAFLVKLKGSGAFPHLEAKIDSMATSAANYIYTQKIDYKADGSFFGYMALESLSMITKSRLAWCYGDLGIASALKDYGVVYKDKAVYDFAVKVLETDATIRKDPTDNGVVDAGLCHGSAGIALIYNNLYLETGLNSFKNAADYWIEQTLRFACFENEYAGFKIYAPLEAGLWRESYGILEGIAGIGLSLASNIYNKKYDWDEFMLLR